MNPGNRTPLSRPISRPPKVIGILGGIASGKSVVARYLEQRGAERLDADRAGHEVLRLPEIRQKVRDRYGNEVLAADGEVDRRALARIVFDPTEAGRQALHDLESITHPEIRRRLERQIATTTAPLVVLDAPVMLKAGWDQFCDYILYVHADRETRLARALTRGWTEEEFLAREAAQESLEEKRRHADVILDNSGTLESTQSEVECFLQSVLG